jgi:hypothetical protein
MRSTGLPVLALFLVGSPGVLAAQASETRADASLEASLARTTVQGSGSNFAGAAGLITLDGTFAFGAAGWLMMGSSTVEGDGAGSDLALSVGYGGLLLQATLAGSPDRNLALRALVGAGNAKIKLPVVGSEIAADNFGVLEPEVLGTVTLAGPLQLGLGAAYRHVFGVEDLPNVAAGDLRGFSARVRLSIRTN